MNVSNLKQISVPGTNKKPNEDGIIILDDLFVVLDGATGLGNKKIAESGSDAQWLVNYISTYFKKNWTFGSQFIPFIEETLRNLNADFFDLVDNSKKIKPFEMPSAGLVAVQLLSDTITAYRIGDCSLYIKDESGITDVFGDSPLNRLDQEAISKMTKALEKGFSVQEARAKIKGLLKKNRSKMNQKNGYSVISVYPDSVNGFETKRIDLLKEIEILLASDGFSALNEKYESSLEEVFHKVKNKSLDAVLNELRELEQDDNELIKFPRLKVHDDATCLYLNLG